MKILIAALVLASTALAQTTITVRQATAPVSSSSAASASSSGGSSSSSASSPSVTDPAVTGSGTSFAEISDGKKAKKAAVVPASLQGSDNDAEPGLNAGINKMHADAATTTPQPAGLHFNDLADGTDAVSAAVRGFQMFCNNHTMQQDEAEVRQWVKANQNIVASSPSEMLRKKQYPEVRDQLIGLKFPKEWFEPAVAPVPPAK
jgi:hypothetical protein